MSARKTVLLIDDDKNVTQNLGTVLTRMGFAVETAESGRIGLKVMKQKRVELAIIRTKHSWFSAGDDTIRAIRKDAKLDGTAVAVMYSEMDDKLKKKCTDAGCNGFMSLPVKMDELHGLLQALVLNRAGIRRKHMRVNARMKVMVYWDSKPGMYTTEVVSEGGLYLRTDKPIPGLSEVLVSIPAPDRDLKVKGLVIYHGGGNGSGVPRGMAVELVGLGPEESASMKMLVERLITGDMDAGAEGAVRRWAGAAETRLRA
jgi:two-component system, chemotaxis family, chemotaxis protein CheY